MTIFISTDINFFPSHRRTALHQEYVALFERQLKSVVQAMASASAWRWRNDEISHGHFVLNNVSLIAMRYDYFHVTWLRRWANSMQLWLQQKSDESFGFTVEIPKFTSIAELMSSFVTFAWGKKELVGWWKSGIPRWQIMEQSGRLRTSMCFHHVKANRVNVWFLNKYTTELRVRCKLHSMIPLSQRKCPESSRHSDTLKNYLGGILWNADLYDTAAHWRLYQLFLQWHTTSNTLED